MATEIESLHEWIQFLRNAVVDSIASAPAEMLNWRPIAAEGGEATNSLAVLAAHLAGAEHFWVGEVVGGLPTTRDRDAEFVVEAASAVELLVLLEKTAQETDEVFRALTPAMLDETRAARGQQVTVRWSLMHVVEHMAMHIGHIQLTRQLWQARAQR